MARLTYENVRKVFADGTVAMADVSLDVEDGEFMVFVGPSGSGKSTFLRVMAGLETPTTGRIRVDGDDVTELEPQERDLAMVFQAYALYPHKTVRENLEFGLRMRGTAEAERRKRVTRIAQTLDIGSLLDRKPGQLSGGQRQRVALGRALVREPKAFLLDEPLSNLDPALRLQARVELARLHRRMDTTFLYVTHDQEEAMTLGDRVAVLRDGHIEQVAPPMELYRRPATRFVGEFIGSPAMNVYRCSVARSGARPRAAQLRGPGFRLEVPEVAAEGLGDSVSLGARPHDVELVGKGTARSADVLGDVELVEPRGSDLLVRLRIGVGPGTGPTPPKSAASPADDWAVLTVVLPSDTKIAEGDRVGARFPRDRLHLFDPLDETRIDAGGAP